MRWLLEIEGEAPASSTLGGERPGDGEVAALRLGVQACASMAATIASRSAARSPCGIGLPARRYQ